MQTRHRVGGFNLLEQNIFFFGLAGSPCSGKTQIGDYVYAQLPDKVAIISGDRYSIPRAEFIQRGIPHYDCPQAYFSDQMLQAINSLKLGHDVWLPEFSFPDDRVVREQGVQIKPNIQETFIVLVDWFLLAAVPAIREMMDMVVFFKCDLATIEKRKFQRDTSPPPDGRGRPYAQVKNQWDNETTYGLKTFVFPSEVHADWSLGNEDSSDEIWPAKKTFNSFLELLLHASDQFETMKSKISESQPQTENQIIEIAEHIGCSLV